jgi:hypothetical protein
MYACTQVRPGGPGVRYRGIKAMLSFVIVPLRVIAGLVLAVGSSTASAGSWGIQVTPNPAAATASYLYGAACPSATVCTAVGTSALSGAYLTLAERWDGQSWAIQPTPNPPTAVAVTELSAVACPSISACTAVGQYWDGSAYHTLAEHWDGLAWAIQPTPDPPGATVHFLTGVACPSGTLCQAVGYYQNDAGDYVPLTAQWNGIAWAIQHAPSPAGTTFSLLKGIDCASIKLCTAVGLYTTSSGVTLTLAERWDGTAWAIQPTPNPTGTHNAELDAVACPSAKTCTAAGFAGSHGTLAERWDGKSWVIQPTPGPVGSTLYGVACPTTRTCTAVGGYTISGTEITLAERWDGKTWAIQPTPNPTGSRSSELDTVACTSAKICTAAGASYNTTGVADTLAEHHS